MVPIVTITYLFFLYIFSASIRMVVLIAKIIYMVVSN